MTNLTPSEQLAALEGWSENKAVPLYERLMASQQVVAGLRAEAAERERELAVAVAEVARLKRLLGKDDDAPVDPNILPESGAPIFLNPEKVTEALAAVDAINYREAFRPTAEETASLREAVEAQATEWRERQKLDPDPRPHHLREEAEQVRADADASSERDGL